MKPELVRFSSHHHPFRVRWQQCSNPDCDCTEVIFHFAEVAQPGDAIAGPMRFAARVDPETWQEVEAPERPAAVAKFVREFLRDYPPQERAAFQEASRKKTELRRRLREHRLDPQMVREGKLVAFREIVSERGSISSGGASCAFRLEHEGTEYLVDDLYCPNPDCQCREVHLLFLRCTPVKDPDDPIRVDDHFMAKLSLNGRSQIEERYRCTRSEAEAVVSAWRDRYANDLERLAWRYDKVKEIGRRSAPRRSGVSQRYDFLPEETAPVGVRAGRNDPCPCGSGKKFKKCCGQRRDTSPRPR